MSAASFACGCHLTCTCPYVLWQPPEACTDAPYWTRHLFETAAPAQHRGSVTSSLRHHRCLLHDYNLYGTVRFP